jgi:hypothetical protein
MEEERKRDREGGREEGKEGGKITSPIDADPSLLQESSAGSPRELRESTNKQDIQGEHA